MRAGEKRGPSVIFSASRALLAKARAWIFRFLRKRE
jgi:hypothetical protein